MLVMFLDDRLLFDDRPLALLLDDDLVGCPVTLVDHFALVNDAVRARADGHASANRAKTNADMNVVRQSGCCTQRGRSGQKNCNTFLGKSP